MITKDNFTQIYNSLTTKEVEDELNDDKDYITLTVNIFNTGFNAEIKSVDYNQELEENVTGSGNIFLNKDNFIELLASYDITI